MTNKFLDKSKQYKNSFLLPLKFKPFVDNQKGRRKKSLKLSLSFPFKAQVILERKKVLNILRKKKKAENNHHRYLLSRIINWHRDNPLRSKLSIVHRLNRGANGSNLDKNQPLSRWRGPRRSSKLLGRINHYYR